MLWNKWYVTGRSPTLMSGQNYALSIELEIPDSPENRQMGMFMTCAQLKSSSDTILKESCKSALMNYRSELLKTLETLIFAPFYLSGHLSETQNLRIEYFKDYLDDPLNPAVKIEYQIKSRFIQVFEVTYSIHADFGGLRFWMFYYPITSAIVGIAFNVTFLTFILMKLDL